MILVRIKVDTRYREDLVKYAKELYKEKYGVDDYIELDEKYIEEHSLKQLVEGTVNEVVFQGVYKEGLLFIDLWIDKKVINKRSEK